MLAQQLRHRVDIEAKVATQDPDTGAMSYAWQTILEGEEALWLVPAAVVALSGREFLQSNAIQHDVTTTITIRERPGLVEDMRIVHEGDLYDIKAILPDASLRRHLTIYCRKGANNG